MKKLKSVLVSGGDKNLQIIKKIAEAIQDAGGEADTDLLRLVSEDGLASKVGKLVVRSILLQVATLDVATKGHQSLQQLVDTVPVGNDIGDSGRRDCVLRALPLNFTCAGQYTLFRVSRKCKLSVAQSIMARNGLKIADSGQLVEALPEIRKYIKEHYTPGWYLRFYAVSQNKPSEGVFFQSQTSHGKDWLSEMLGCWNAYELLSPSSQFVLAQGAV